MRYLLVPLLLGVLLLGGGRAAAKDDPKAPTGAGYEETELRLKTAGIDAALRGRIHEAIRRGVTVLRKVQMRDGSILGNDGQTTLGGLALTHAAIPEGQKGGRAAMAWILRRAKKKVANQTYQAGLAAMLFESHERGRAEQKYLVHLHGRLQRGPKSDHGYWGYRSAGGDPTPNLSTAQFACLGLWAAERGGAKPAPKAWRIHLDALLASQTHAGSWGYYPASSPLQGRRGLHGYPTGTFMGLANLALAREALAEQLAADPELEARVRVAVAKGTASLRRHAQWILTADATPGQLGHYPYYRLYALEKACVFLDLEDLGGVRWYEEGARQLLAQQLPKTGGWGSYLTDAQRKDFARRRLTVQPLAQQTAFALLFLLRASAAFHPITPRPILKQKARVVTPQGKTPAGEGEADEDRPAKRAPPLMLAQGAVARLEKALDGTRLATLRPMLDAMRLVGRMLRASRTADGGFATPGHETWARRVEAVMLRIATRFQSAKANDRVLWWALALASLEALPDLHPRIGPRLMEAVLSVERDVTFRPSFRYVWYATAIEALRRVDPPGLATWLGERAISDDPHLGWRSSAAMTALGGMAPAMTGRQRHGAARSIWRRLDMLQRKSGGNLLEGDLMRDMIVLTHRLAAASGRTQGLPPVGTLDPAETIADLRAWWQVHDDPGDPLWQ